MYLFELPFSFSLDIYPGMELLDHMVVVFLMFQRSSMLLSTVAINLHSHQQCMRVPFCPSPRRHLLCVLFDDSYSDRCEVIPHCGFDLHFPDG